jgi:signal transduction histidine kinase
MTVTTANKPTLGVPQRPLRRSSADYILGGVCGGLAIRLGVRERTIRILFSLSALIVGLGILAYVAAWFLMARSGEDESIAQRLTKNRRESQTLILVGALIVAGLLALNAFRFHGVTGFEWTLLFSMVGLVAIWRGISSDERSKLEGVINATPILGSATAKGWKAVTVRVVLGAALVIIGLKYLGHVGGIWGGAVPALIGTAVFILGALILLAPWWLQTVRDLAGERRERVRVEERAAMVAHIHDSVLQTLTLIERAAGNEADVVRLARAQERELRQWLFNPDSIGDDSCSTTFAGLIGRIEGDIEHDYGVKVELVMVGDCPVDERVSAVAGAGREAAVNSAKWSGAPMVSIFAEVENDTMSMFVRDTGIGFDPTSVASDRQGIALSIKQRMNLHGGYATIRSAPGTGTEVQLILPRHGS